MISLELIDVFKYVYIIQNNKSKYRYWPYIYIYKYIYTFITPIELLTNHYKKINMQNSLPCTLMVCKPNMLHCKISARKNQSQRPKASETCDDQMVASPKCNVILDGKIYSKNNKNAWFV